MWTQSRQHSAISEAITDYEWSCNKKPEYWSQTVLDSNRIQLIPTCGLRVKNRTSWVTVFFSVQFHEDARSCGNSHLPAAPSGCGRALTSGSCTAALCPQGRLLSPSLPLSSLSCSYLSLLGCFCLKQGTRDHLPFLPVPSGQQGSVANPLLILSPSTNGRCFSSH